jgi:hypothetical protein
LIYGNSDRDTLASVNLEREASSNTVSDTVRSRYKIRQVTLSLARGPARQLDSVQKNTSSKLRIVHCFLRFTL